MMGAMDACHGPAVSLPWVTTRTQLAQGRLVGGRCVCVWGLLPTISPDCSEVPLPDRGYRWPRMCRCRV